MVCCYSSKKTKQKTDTGLYYFLPMAHQGNFSYIWPKVFAQLLLPFLLDTWNRISKVVKTPEWSPLWECKKHHHTETFRRESHTFCDFPINLKWLGEESVQIGRLRAGQQALGHHCHPMQRGDGDRVLHWGSRRWPSLFSPVTRALGDLRRSIWHSVIFSIQTQCWRPEQQRNIF